MLVVPGTNSLPTASSFLKLRSFSIKCEISVTERIKNAKV